MTTTIIISRRNNQEVHAAADTNEATTIPLSLCHAVVPSRTMSQFSGDQSSPLVSSSKINKTIVSDYATFNRC